MTHSNHAPETVDGSRFNEIDVARIRHNEDLFFLLCSASFVKSAAHFLAQKLAQHFAGDQQLVAWLDQQWLPQAQQQGRELAAYIQVVWPEFDWAKGFNAFSDEYGKACFFEALESRRGLELAARCVLETDAASRYRALNDINDEPVLRQLISHVQSTELRHYTYFYQCYRQYQERERFGRYAVLRMMLRRIHRIRTKDSELALRHVFNQCYPQQLNDETAFRRLGDHVHGVLRRHMPVGMTAKMLLKLLNLPSRLNDALEKPLANTAGRIFLR